MGWPLGPANWTGVQVMLGLGLPVCQVFMLLGLYMVFWGRKNLIFFAFFRIFFSEEKRGKTVPVPRDKKIQDENLVVHYNIYDLYAKIFF